MGLFGPRIKLMCRSRRDVKGLDREVEKGSNAQKVTEWKPAFLRRQGTSPESTGLLPPWFESRSWLTKLKRSDAEVFRPKFALMQAGACTEHHRDNYGTLTWIKVLGGSQFLATWNMVFMKPRPRRRRRGHARAFDTARTTRRSMTKSFLGKRSRNYLLHDWSF